MLLLSSKVDFLLTSFISFSTPSTTQQISTIYSCELCNYEAEDISVLKTHKETNHQKFVSCHKCDFKSKELNDLKAQKSDKYPPITYSCEQCEYTTMHTNQLQKHVRITHIQDFSCNFCDYKAGRNEDLNMHIQTIHAPRFPCDLCSYKADHTNDLRRHVRAMHGEKQHSRFYSRSRSPNTNINKKFVSQLTKNINENNDNEPSELVEANKPFRCVDTCEQWQKTFEHKEQLELHSMFFHGNLPQ